MWTAFCLCFLLSSSGKQRKKGLQRAPTKEDNETRDRCGECFPRRLLVVITPRKAKANVMAAMISAALGNQTFPEAHVGADLRDVSKHKW